MEIKNVDGLDDDENFDHDLIMNAGTNGESSIFDGLESDRNISHDLIINEGIK